MNWNLLDGNVIKQMKNENTDQSKTLKRIPIYLRHNTSILPISLKNNNQYQCSSNNFLANDLIIKNYYAHTNQNYDYDTNYKTKESFHSNSSSSFRDDYINTIVSQYCSGGKIHENNHRRNLTKSDISSSKKFTRLIPLKQNKQLSIGTNTVSNARDIKSWYTNVDEKRNALSLHKDSIVPNYFYGPYTSNNWIKRKIKTNKFNCKLLPKIKLIFYGSKYNTNNNKIVDKRIQYNLKTQYWNNWKEKQLKKEINIISDTMRSIKEYRRKNYNPKNI